MSGSRCENGFLAEARHENVNTQRTRRSRSRQAVAQPAAIEGKAKTAIRCRLCRETIVLETNFRPTAATCPHCGLKFVFDPQQEPLPVRGLRLRYADVLEAQRRTGTVQHQTARRARAARGPTPPGEDELPGLGRRPGPLAGCGHRLLRRLVSPAAGAVAIRVLLSGLVAARRSRR